MIKILIFKHLIKTCIMSQYIRCIGANKDGSQCHRIVNLSQDKNLDLICYQHKTQDNSVGFAHNARKYYIHNLLINTGLFTDIVNLILDYDYNFFGVCCKIKETILAIFDNYDYPSVHILSDGTVLISIRGGQIAMKSLFDRYGSRYKQNYCTDIGVSEKFAKNEQILFGHSGYITCVAHDENTIITGSQDKKIIIWKKSINDDSKSEICDLGTNNKRRKQSLEISNKRQRKSLEISNKRRKQKRIRNNSRTDFPTINPKQEDRRQWIKEHILVGHTKWIRYVNILHSDLIISWADDNELRIWNSRTGSCEFETRISSNITCMVIIKESSRCISEPKILINKIACGLNNGGLIIYKIQSDRQPYKSYIHQMSIHHEIHLPEDNHEIVSIASLKDGRIVSASDKLRVWNPISGICEFILKSDKRIEYGGVLPVNKVLGAHTWVEYVNILPDNKVISMSSDGALRLWSVPIRTCDNKQITLNAEYGVYLSENPTEIHVLDDGQVITRQGCSFASIWQ